MEKLIIPITFVAAILIWGWIMMHLQVTVSTLFATTTHTGALYQPK